MGWGLSSSALWGYLERGSRANDHRRAEACDSLVITSSTGLAEIARVGASHRPWNSPRPSAGPEEARARRAGPGGAYGVLRGSAQDSSLALMPPSLLEPAQSDDFGRRGRDGLEREDPRATLLDR